MLLIEKILQSLQTDLPNVFFTRVRQMVDTQSVLMVRLSDGFLMTRVKDEQGQIHTSHSHLRQWDTKNYKCSCNKPMPCPHLIAGMMSWLDNHGESKKKKEQALYQYQWFDKEISDTPVSQWQAELSGNEAQGFHFGLQVEQETEHWNIVDILVHLLETYDYNSLMRKDDAMIFQVMNHKEQKLTISWWRLKWFLQKMVGGDLNANHSSLRLKNNWKVLQEFQSWSLKASDEHNLWSGNQSWKKMLWLLTPKEDSLEDAIPKGLQSNLRPYQIEGVRWLHRLSRAGYGGVLADDMGLGKTIQTLTYLLGLKEKNLLKKPALIVVPTSLLANWQDESNRFTPALNLQLFHSKSKAHKLWDTCDLIVTSYGMVQRYHSLFTEYHFSHIILDEAQLIKNFQSQKSMVLKKCQADTKFCLTGTPMENHLGELWSLLDFAVPQLLGNRSQFRKNFQNPIEVDANDETKTQLLARIHPFLLRRTKNQVVSNLPKKTTIVQKMTLQASQLELYETFRCMLAEKVQLALAEKGLLESRWVVLDALLKLRQICCDPRLLPPQWHPVAKDISSAKLIHLLEILENLIAEGRSVLVFSQFTKMLHLIEGELQKRDLPYFLLTGKTQKREVLVERFQNKEAPIFLLSLKAGGLGLNLTTADTVIHYEPWWNPAVTAQATDRIHRIGQEQPVFEYHYILEGTIEQSMRDLQEKKQGLFSNTIDASGQSKYRWTEEDIMKLFSPIA